MFKEYNGKKYKIICKMKFGSNLYGTATKDSDMDYIGVFIPEKNDLLLGNHLESIPKEIKFNTSGDSQKNTSEDVDEKYFSLQFFLKMAFDGETATVDMLHADLEQLEYFTPIWVDLHYNRQKFYTSKMTKYLGYCRHQASKYSVKKERIELIESIIKTMRICCEETKLTKYYDAFVDTYENNKFFNSGYDEKAKLRYVEICGKKHHESNSLGYIKKQLQKHLDSYGQRAKNLLSGNVDWKAVSHAFRAGFQIREILLTNDLKFPLANRDFLVELKTGQLDYENEGIAQQLDDLLQEVEELCEKSNLPEEVNREFFTNWLLNLYM